jgi:hypothetical protein
MASLFEHRFGASEQSILCQNIDASKFLLKLLDTPGALWVVNASSGVHQRGPAFLAGNDREGCSGKKGRRTPQLLREYPSQIGARNTDLSHGNLGVFKRDH